MSKTKSVVKNPKESAIWKLLFSEDYFETVTPALIKDLETEKIKMPFVDGHVVLCDTSDWIATFQGSDTDRLEFKKSLIGNLPLLYIQIGAEQPSIYDDAQIDVDVQWNDVYSIELMEALSQFEQTERWAHVVSIISGQGVFALHEEVLKRISYLLELAKESKPFMFGDMKLEDFKPHTFNDHQVRKVNSILEQFDWVINAAAYSAIFDGIDGNMVMVDVDPDVPRIKAQALLQFLGSVIFEELDLEDFWCGHPHEQIELKTKLIPYARS